jgi:predicted ester cyclase
MFFDDLETGKGPLVVKKYLAEKDVFQCDCLPQTNLTEYAEFMQNIIKGPMPDFKYEIESITYNENEVSFYATFTGTHTGQGGPVPPSNPPKKTKGTYVYKVTLDQDGKVTKMNKCFDIFTAFKALGWPL